MHLYGKPTLGKIQRALARLSEYMDRRAPVEVMLCVLEEVKMFFLANDAEDRQLKEPQIHADTVNILQLLS